MEKHSIESLDQFVHVTINPDAMQQATPEQINDYTANAIELTESLRKQLLRDILYSKTEQETKLLLEGHQIIVTNMLNLLFSYEHFEPFKYHIKQFYEQVAARLKQIILFLKNNFGRFFNTELNLPLHFRLKEIREINRQLKMVTKAMVGSETNFRLMIILDQSIKPWLSLKEDTAVTYRQINYFKNLLTDISSYQSTSPPSQFHASLTELLIDWNFNNLAFIREVCNNLKVEVNEKGSIDAKLESLRSFMKKVNQLTEKSNISFNLDQPTAKQMIQDWVWQELYYLEVATSHSESKEVQEHAKIHTSLSVPALALFTRLFKDSGIFTNTKQEEILKFMSSNFTTQRKLAVSLGHLHSKYYQIDEVTKRKVFDHLMEMAQRCKKL